MFDFVEEAFDQIALAIESAVERRMFLRLGMGLTLAFAPRAARLWRRASQS